jgi:hypothetical protein
VRRAWPAGASLLAAVALSACGSDSGAEPDGSAAEPVGQELGGSVAPLAQCSDWVGASEAEKLATIEDIRSQVNRQDAGVRSSELSDERALEVLDNGCDLPEARSYRLYILYSRAAAFEPLREIAEGEAPPP